MKIGNPDHSKVPVAPTGTEPGKAKARNADGTTAAAGQPSATVELAIASAAQAAAGAGADFDTAKVERITQAIRDGHYEVNAEAIADKLIANAHEVLSRVRR